MPATRASRAREREQGRRRTPIIMLTANAMVEHVQASAEAGADAHLAKPIQASALFETIGRVLGFEGVETKAQAAA